MTVGRAAAGATAQAARAPLQLLWEHAPTGKVRGMGMPIALERRYDGPLLIPLHDERPTVIANFVSTLDGIVSLGSGELSGGALISGAHEPDHFGMGLLRAVADVVVIGAGTLRASKEQQWTPASVHPASADALTEWRRTMGLAPQPTTVVLTASGNIPVEHAGLNNAAVPVVIRTTTAGAARLAKMGLAAHIEVDAGGGEKRVTGTDILALGERLGARVMLCEGGPHLIGEVLAADALDELFLTLAPQLVGRGQERLGLVEGIELVPPDTRWLDLVAVRRSGNHLFLRHRRPARSGQPEES